MATEVEIHKRQFAEDLQKVIAAECESKKIVWRGFKGVALIALEIEMGTKMAEKMLPEPLREHLRYKVDPFNYSVSFYLSIGYECSTCDN